MVVSNKFNRSYYQNINFQGEAAVRQYKKAVDIVNSAFLWVSIALLIVVMVASILQVFTRTVLNNAMVGTEEVARYAFIWVSFLGSSLGISKFSHPTVDMLNNALTGKKKHIHTILTQLCVIAFGVILMIHGGRVVSVVLKQLSPTLRLPMAYVYGACPTGGLGIILNAILVIFSRIEMIRKGGAEA